MRCRFIKEFARYTQAQIIGGFDGLGKREKEVRIANINNVIDNFDRGLITVNEAIQTILNISGGAV